MVERERRVIMVGSPSVGSASILSNTTEVHIIQREVEASLSTFKITPRYGDLGDFGFKRPETRAERRARERETNKNRK